jgi:hypothetical protein
MLEISLFAATHKNNALQATRPLKSHASRRRKSKVFHDQPGTNNQPLPSTPTSTEGSESLGKPHGGVLPPHMVLEVLPCILDDYDVTLVHVAIATMLSEIQIKSNSMVSTIYNFVQRSYELAEWSPAATIAASVLVLRWVKNGNDFSPQTWKTVLLVALLVAQKITDDTPLQNGEFCKIWQKVSEKPYLLTPLEVAGLEKSFVHSLDWHVFVDSRTMILVYRELVAMTRARA